MRRAFRRGSRSQWLRSLWGIALLATNLAAAGCQKEVPETSQAPVARAIETPVGTLSTAALPSVEIADETRLVLRGHPRFVLRWHEDVPLGNKLQIEERLPQELRTGDLVRVDVLLSAPDPETRGLGLLKRRVSPISTRIPIPVAPLLIRSAEGATSETPDLSLVIPIPERLRGLDGLLSMVARPLPPSSIERSETPSVKEGWGITVVEANALGVPVVATDAPGLRDAVRHGETGLLVPDAEPSDFARGLAGAIETLLSNDELAARLAKQARAWSRSFTWDAAADAMEAAVADALGTRP